MLNILTIHFFYNTSFSVFERYLPTLFSFMQVQFIVSLYYFQRKLSVKRFDEHVCMHGQANIIYVKRFWTMPLF